MQVIKMKVENLSSQAKEAKYVKPDIHAYLHYLSSLHKSAFVSKVFGFPSKLANQMFITGRLLYVYYM